MMTEHKPERIMEAQDALRLDAINSTVNIDTRLGRLYELLENDLLGALTLGSHYIAPYKARASPPACHAAALPPPDPAQGAWHVPARLAPLVSLRSSRPRCASPHDRTAGEPASRLFARPCAHLQTWYVKLLAGRCATRPAVLQQLFRRSTSAVACRASRGCVRAAAGTCSARPGLPWACPARASAQGRLRTRTRRAPHPRRCRLPRRRGRRGRLRAPRRVRARVRVRGAGAPASACATSSADWTAARARLRHAEG